MTVSGRFEGTNAATATTTPTIYYLLVSPFGHFIAHPMHKVIATAKKILKDDFKTLDDYFPRKVLPW